MATYREFHARATLADYGGASSVEGGNRSGYSEPFVVEKHAPLLGTTIRLRSFDRLTELCDAS